MQQHTRKVLLHTKFWSAFGSPNCF